MTNSKSSPTCIIVPSIDMIHLLNSVPFLSLKITSHNSDITPYRSLNIIVVAKIGT